MTAPPAPSPTDEERQAELDFANAGVRWQITGRLTGIEYTQKRLTKADLWDRPELWPCFDLVVGRMIAAQLKRTTLSPAERALLERKAKEFRDRVKVFEESGADAELELLIRGTEEPEIVRADPGPGQLVADAIPAAEQTELCEELFTRAAGLDFAQRRVAADRAARFRRHHASSTTVSDGTAPESEPGEDPGDIESVAGAGD